MQYNPAIHKRRSIRLKGYDYSQAGLYFITICVQHRKHLFGNIKNGNMITNDAGQMVEQWYCELENKFPDIRCDEMITMPDHFHCIIHNIGVNTAGADLCVCPDTLGEHTNTLGEHTNTLGEHTNTLGEHTNTLAKHTNTLAKHTNTLGEHTGSPLWRVVQWFKTMTTNAYIRGVKQLGWQPFNGKLWQRNYYERIIRNEQAYQNIARYIRNNPAKWQADTRQNAR